MTSSTARWGVIGCPANDPSRSQTGQAAAQPAISPIIQERARTETPPASGRIVPVERDHHIQYTGTASFPFVTSLRASPSPAVSTHSHHSPSRATAHICSAQTDKRTRGQTRASTGQSARGSSQSAEHGGQTPAAAPRTPLTASHITLGRRPLASARSQPAVIADISAGRSP